MPTGKNAGIFLFTPENVEIVHRNTYFWIKKKWFWLMSIPARNYPHVTYDTNTVTKWLQKKSGRILISVTQHIHTITVSIWHSYDTDRKHQHYHMNMSNYDRCCITWHMTHIMIYIKQSHFVWQMTWKRITYKTLSLKSYIFIPGRPSSHPPFSTARCGGLYRKVS